MVGRGRLRAAAGVVKPGILSEALLRSSPVYRGTTFPKPALSCGRSYWSPRQGCRDGPPTDAGPEPRPRAPPQRKGSLGLGMGSVRHRRATDTLCPPLQSTRGGHCPFTSKQPGPHVCGSTLPSADREKLTMAGICRVPKCHWKPVTRARVRPCASGQAMAGGFGPSRRDSPCKPRKGKREDTSLPSRSVSSGFPKWANTGMAPQPWHQHRSERPSFGTRQAMGWPPPRGQLRGSGLLNNRGLRGDGEGSTAAWHASSPRGSVSHPFSSPRTLTPRWHGIAGYSADDSPLCPPPTETG